MTWASFDARGKLRRFPPTTAGRQNLANSFVGYSGSHIRLALHPNSSVCISSREQTPLLLAKTLYLE